MVSNTIYELFTVFPRIEEKTVRGKCEKKGEYSKNINEHFKLPWIRGFLALDLYTWDR